MTGSSKCLLELGKMLRETKFKHKTHYFYKPNKRMMLLESVRQLMQLDTCMSNRRHNFSFLSKQINEEKQ